MKALLFTIIKWIAALYAVGYIVNGYTIDTFWMRVLHSMMLTIFSVNVLVYILKKVEYRLQKNTHV
ncbi:hypothetical protein A6M13_03220 [Caryophanon tenue]|uniref:Uncharacterized protein n=1 Tax=Caryophanon tenue TaxID=33978 RepID=A0A1C0YBS8_9BACL|nr:hypothetical protein A6M13_03220 [Caryophanon tenue]